ncbi:MAG: AAA family ATPase [Deltaproteobacteria bacterium]|nr:AAA family ATPase [Deltaproteobacteria bacterium]
MHATRLQASNFRLFDKLDLDKLAPFTLLVGRNNVGKTAVLEAFVAALSRDPIVATATLDRARELVPTRNATTMEVFRTLFHKLEPNISEIVLKLSGPKLNRRVRIWTEQPAESSSVDAVNSGEPFEPDRDIHWAVDIDGAQVCKATAWRDPREQRTNRKWSGYDEAPNRVYLSTSMWLGDEFLDTFSQIKRMGGLQPILAVLKKLSSGLSDLQILTYGGQPRLEARVGDVEMPIQLLGDGSVRTLTYLLAATRAQGGFLMIDEIERGIHFEALVDVLVALRRRAADAETQIVATTHSDECIRAVKSAFADAPEQWQLIRLTRDTQGAIEVAAPDADSTSSAIEFGMELR